MKSFIYLAIVLVANTCFNRKDEPIEKKFRFEKQITVGNLTRTFTVVLPENFYEEKDFPVVFGLHGGGGSGSQFENHYNFSPLALKRGYVVVYPDGIQSDGILRVRTWNGGTCCDYAMEKQIDDVGFFSALIDQVIKDYKVNPRKVYFTGMSNGAIMSYRLACELSGKITAIAAVSGSLSVIGDCKATRPVPVMHLHSVKDEKVPHLGGTGINGITFAPVLSGLDTFAKLNDCNKTANIMVDDQKYKLTVWNNCRNSSQIVYYLTQDGGHSWPGAEWIRQAADEPSHVIDANSLILDFFEKF
ncbi:MAG: PHB depolymerase family esterase [Spirosomataceae bacterium]|jgi:polyhydroxybutyrate depolymerase